MNAVIDAELDSASRAAVQTEAQARAVAGTVADPELPYLDLDDLGVLREVRVTGPRRIRVTVTPTFLGCPATAVIQRDIESALREQGWVDVDVSLVHSPAWTPDRISDRGRAKLAAEGYGIPARGGATGGPVPVTIGLKPVSSSPVGSSPVSFGSSQSAALPLACPQCGAADTAVLSPFGATPCMEMRRCTSCGEPFPALRPVNHLGSGPA